MICILATVGLSIYSMYRYSLNEDTTEVRVTSFLSSKDSIYPSLSFCILPPFLKNNFTIYGDENINLTSYQNFLKGDFWDDKMLKVDYDNVTIALSDNLINGTYKTHSRKVGIVDWNVQYFVSFRSLQRKCFTIRAPTPTNGLLLHSWLKIKSDIFPEGKISDDQKIYTYLHYPGQRFTAYYTIKNDFDSRQNKSNNYRMVFRVQNIDVIIRRNKMHEPCLDGEQHYDELYLQKWTQKIGCRPYHWKFEDKNDITPICSNSSQMKKFLMQPDTIDVESFTPPCKTIDQLEYIYHEEDITDQG